MNNSIEQYNPLSLYSEELRKFALIGREKLKAVKAEINAIQKLTLAEEVRKQKLEEAQDIADLVADAETKIGEFTLTIPKATPNNNPFHEIIDSDNLVKPKKEVVEELGFSQNEISQFQRMAKNKDIVEQAKSEARENGDIVSRSFIMSKIGEQKKPHISLNSGNNEWYTPKEYIEAAYKVMGEIDLDPASSDIANSTVQADTYFTAEDDGLSKDWYGRVWLNPPYAVELIPLFMDKLKYHYENGDISEAVILVNNATETGWFNTLISVASAVVFPKSRVKFYMPDGKTGAPLQGQAVAYIGANKKIFMEAFSPFGWGAFL